MSLPHSKSRLLPRREFIKRTSLLGASALVVPSWLEAKPGDASAKTELKNDHFLVSFNALRGTGDVLRSQGALLLSGGSACVKTLAGKQSIASPGREFDVDTTAFRDALGRGQRMTILAKDPEKRLNLHLEVSLYDQRPIVAFEVFCTNVSSREVMVHSLERMRVVASEGGMLQLPGVAKCLTNDEMYYDAGTLRESPTLPERE